VGPKPPYESPFRAWILHRRDRIGDSETIPVCHEDQIKVSPAPSQPKQRQSERGDLSLTDRSDRRVEPRVLGQNEPWVSRISGESDSTSGWPLKWATDCLGSANAPRRAFGRMEQPSSGPRNDFEETSVAPRSFTSSSPGAEFERAPIRTTSSSRPGRPRSSTRRDFVGSARKSTFSLLREAKGCERTIFLMGPKHRKIDPGNH
jgi:hypothetical protein